MNIDDKKTPLEMNQKNFFEQIEDEKEKSIRKRWLISLFALAAIKPILTILDCIQDEEFVDPLEFSVFVVMSFVIAVCVSLFTFSIPYYFAYKKRPCCTIAQRITK